MRSFRVIYVQKVREGGAEIKIFCNLYLIFWPIFHEPLTNFEFHTFPYEYHSLYDTGNKSLIPSIIWIVIRFAFHLGESLCFSFVLYCCIDMIRFGINDSNMKILLMQSLKWWMNFRAEIEGVCQLRMDNTSCARIRNIRICSYSYWIRSECRLKWF